MKERLITVKSTIEGRSRTEIMAGEDLNKRMVSQHSSIGEWRTQMQAEQHERPSRSRQKLIPSGFQRELLVNMGGTEPRRRERRPTPPPPAFENRPVLLYWVENRVLHCGWFTIAISLDDTNWYPIQTSILPNNMNPLRIHNGRPFGFQHSRVATIADLISLKVRATFFIESGRHLYHAIPAVTPRGALRYDDRQLDQGTVERRRTVLRNRANSVGSVDLSSSSDTAGQLSLPSGSNCQKGPGRYQ